MGALYDNLREMCDERHITAKEMCKGAGIAINTMTELKSGRIKGVGAATLQKLADYFGCSTTRLLQGRDLDRAIDALENLRAEDRALLDAVKDMPAEDVAQLTDFILMMRGKKTE